MFELTSQDRQAMTALLQELVRTPSYSAQEGDVAACLAAAMRRVGIQDVRVDRIGNVIGRIGPGRGKKLLYNGHMDTVKAGDPTDWLRDPFGGIVENGVLYGRGAADMKGALVAMVYAAKMLLDARVPLAGDLYIVGIVQEEPYEGLGMKVLIEEEGLRPDWVVLGEPTDLQVSKGHRGRLGLQVTVRGKSSHGSAPHLGRNAIYDATRVIARLEALADHLASDAVLGKGSLAVTEIDSNAASRNAVPDRCSFYIDRRLIPGETEESVLAEVQQVIDASGVDAAVMVTEFPTTAYTGYETRVREYYPAWVMPEDDPLVQASLDAIRRTLDHEPRLILWEFGTDGSYTRGVAGIPTVGLGPGEERYAHTAQEQIRLDDVAAAARVYAQLAVDMLGSQG